MQMGKRKAIHLRTHTHGREHTYVILTLGEADDDVVVAQSVEGREQAILLLLDAHGVLAQRLYVHLNPVENADEPVLRMSTKVVHYLHYLRQRAAHRRCGDGTATLLVSIFVSRVILAGSRPVADGRRRRLPVLALHLIRNLAGWPAR